MTRSRLPEDDHFFRVEITFAAAIATPEGRIFGDNVVDCTVAFNLSMQRPPEGASDADINRVLAHHLSPVMAAVQTQLTIMGYAVLGIVDQSMTQNSSPTGELGRTSPVTVHVSMGMPTVIE